MCLYLNVAKDHVRNVVSAMAKEWAKDFYNSKIWRDTADSVKADNNYMCAKCGERPAEIVHHIVWLTPKNINDVNITLNKENLMPVCRECHAIIHEGASATVDGLVFNEKGELIEVKNIYNL